MKKEKRQKGESKYKKREKLERVCFDLENKYITALNSGEKLKADKLKSDLHRLEIKLSAFGKLTSRIKQSRELKRALEEWKPIKNKLPPRPKGKNITQVDLKRSRKRKLGITDNLQSFNGNKLSWVILPPAKCKSWSSFEPIFEAQLKTVNCQILQKDIEEQKIRFKRIFELKPKKIFKGIESFSDYFALIYEGTSKVVLESVVYGNAVYIVDGNWMKKSQQTKSQLKKDGAAKVIPHRGDWFSKIKNYLQIGFE